jgi:hypothetical protein
MCEDKWLLSCSEGGTFWRFLEAGVRTFRRARRQGGFPRGHSGGHSPTCRRELLFLVAALTQTFLTSTSLKNQNVFAHKGRVLVVLSESFNLAEQCS